MSEKIRNKRILVTGGAGFIGSNVAERLASENRVTILDDFSTGERENVSFLPQNRVIDGSVTDPSVVASAVADKDLVLHMAAVMGVRRTLENLLDVLQVNIDGTRTVLEAAANADVERVLVASTSEVYGDLVEPPYHESDLVSPKTDYAVAKVADERFAEAYEEEYGLDYTIVRYFNVYGPRQDSSAYGYVVPRFTKKAVNDETLTIHGDGKQTRDFTYIDDAVDGTVRALSSAGRNEVFNIGRGREVEIRELARTVRDVVGSGRLSFVDHPRPRPYRVERRCPDVTKARDRLGYEPQTSLHDGVERAAFALRAENKV